MSVNDQLAVKSTQKLSSFCCFLDVGYAAVATSGTIEATSGSSRYQLTVFVRLIWLPFRGLGVEAITYHSTAYSNSQSGCDERMTEVAESLTFADRKSA